MKPTRLSIAGLMAVVVLIALGLAAMRNPTIHWASLIFTATVAFLATAILGAMARRGRARMTWAGIAVFGWAYFAMSFGPLPNGNGVDCPPFPTQAVIEAMRRSRESASVAQFRNSSTVTTLTYDSSPQPEVIPEVIPLVPKTIGYGTVIQGFPMGDQMVEADGRLKKLSSPHAFSVAPATIRFAGAYFDWKNHRRIGHSLGAILFGLIGAIVGRVLASRDEPAIETRTPPA